MLQETKDIHFRGRAPLIIFWRTGPMTPVTAVLMARRPAQIDLDCLTSLGLILNMHSNAFNNPGTITRNTKILKISKDTVSKDTR